MCWLGNVLSSSNSFRSHHPSLSCIGLWPWSSTPRSEQRTLARTFRPSQAGDSTGLPSAYLARFAVPSLERPILGQGTCKCTGTSVCSNAWSGSAPRSWRLGRWDLGSGEAARRLGGIPFHGWMFQIASSLLYII